MPRPLESSTFNNFPLQRLGHLSAMTGLMPTAHLSLRAMYTYACLPAHQPACLPPPPPHTHTKQISNALTFLSAKAAMPSASCRAKSSCWPASNPDDDGSLDWRRRYSMSDMEQTSVTNRGGPEYKKTKMKWEGMPSLSTQCHLMFDNQRQVCSYRL